MGAALVYLIACGALLNALFLWWAYCWAIGVFLDAFRFKA